MPLFNDLEQNRMSGLLCAQNGLLKSLYPVTRRSLNAVEFVSIHDKWMAL